MVLTVSFKVYVCEAYSYALSLICKVNDFF